jgi:RNA polymerase sigma-70 factor (ECF subfamily)
MQEREFVELLTKHQNIVHKICHVYLNEPADKEDLFQEITLQAWKAVKNFRGDAQFSTWLYRVALNTAITFYKREQRAIISSAAYPVAHSTEHDPVEEQVAALYKAIGNLSKIDKALVMLYLDDFSYKEMAAMLGMTVSNVGVKMNRIKTKLREEAAKYYTI